MFKQIRPVIQTENRLTNNDLFLKNRLSKEKLRTNFGKSLNETLISLLMVIY